MAKARGDLLHTLKQKLVGKAQLYGFLTDSSGSAVLDAGGNEQVSEVQVGENGRLKVDASITGSLTKDYFEGSATVTKDYSTSPMTGVDIANDGSSSLTYTVGELIMTILPGDSDSRNFDAFTSLTVTTSSAFRCWVRG